MPWWGHQAAAGEGEDGLATAKEMRIFDLTLEQAREVVGGPTLAEMIAPGASNLEGPIPIKGKPAYKASLPPGIRFGQYTKSQNFGSGTWGKYTEWDAKFVCWAWLKRAEAAGRV